MKSQDAKEAYRVLYENLKGKLPEEELKIVGLEMVERVGVFEILEERRKNRRTIPETPATPSEFLRKKMGL